MTGRQHWQRRSPVGGVHAASTVRTPARRRGAVRAHCRAKDSSAAFAPRRARADDGASLTSAQTHRGTGVRTRGCIPSAHAMAEFATELRSSEQDFGAAGASMTPRVLYGLIDIELPVRLLDQRHYERAGLETRNELFDQRRLPAAGSAGKAENAQRNLTSRVSAARYGDAIDHHRSRARAQAAKRQLRMNGTGQRKWPSAMFRNMPCPACDEHRCFQFGAALSRRTNSADTAHLPNYQ